MPFFFKKKKLFFFKSSRPIDDYINKNNSYFYNLNLIPFNYINKKKIKFIFRKLNVFKNQYFPKLYTHIISVFLEKLTKQKIFIKLYTNLRVSSFEKV